MKERPILFNGEMVRAILEGRKTQTRRIVKQPVSNSQKMSDGLDHTHSPMICKNGDWLKPSEWSPYGQPGDRLWVREMWRIGAWRSDGGRMAIDYVASPEITRTPWVTIPEDQDVDGEKFNKYWINICDELQKKQIFPEVDGEYSWEPGKAPLRWHPSIHMPRWASRITLEVVNIRVERLHEISVEDVKAEGVTNEVDITWMSGADTPRGIFGEYWDFINAKRGYSWEFNPWVWVVEFKRIEIATQSTAQG